MPTKSKAAAKREEWLLGRIQYPWQDRSIHRLVESARGMGDFHCNERLLRTAAIGARAELLRRVGRLDEIFAETADRPRKR